MERSLDEWKSFVTIKITKNQRDIMKIQILGTGCPKCKKLAETATVAADELQLDYELEKVTDINQIMTFGVMMTPALVVDGEVKLAGKVPSAEEMKKLFTK
jgi:small redox-active disulfide protein 2